MQPNRCCNQCHFKTKGERPLGEEREGEEEREKVEGTQGEKWKEARERRREKSKKELQERRKEKQMPRGMQGAWALSPHEREPK